MSLMPTAGWTAWSFPVPVCWTPPCSASTLRANLAALTPSPPTVRQWTLAATGNVTQQNMEYYITCMSNTIPGVLYNSITQNYNNFPNQDNNTRNKL